MKRKNKLQRLLMSAAALVMLSGASVPQTLSAAEAETAEVLVVTLRDGTQDQYLLREKPKISFASTTCDIQSETFSAAYDMADVKNAAFSTSVVGGVEITPDVNFRIDLSNPDEVRISGLAPGSPVSIHGISGITVFHGEPDAEGCLCIRTGDFAPSIYILNAGNGKSIKIYKK